MKNVQITIPINIDDSEAGGGAHDGSLTFSVRVPTKMTRHEILSRLEDKLEDVFRKFVSFGED